MDGVKFITDATRLAQQSPFIRDMLFNGTVLGSNDEGTAGNPIKLIGVTKAVFVHFLKWFNHTYICFQSIHDLKLITMLFIDLGRR